MGLAGHVVGQHHRQHRVGQHPHVRVPDVGAQPVGPALGEHEHHPRATHAAVDPGPLQGRGVGVVAVEGAAVQVEDVGLAGQPGQGQQQALAPEAGVGRGVGVHRRHPAPGQQQAEAQQGAQKGGQLGEGAAVGVGGQVAHRALAAEAGLLPQPHHGSDTAAGVQGRPKYHNRRRGLVTHGCGPPRRRRCAGRWCAACRWRCAPWTTPRAVRHPPCRGTWSGRTAAARCRSRG